VGLILNFFGGHRGPQISKECRGPPGLPLGTAPAEAHSATVNYHTSSINAKKSSSAKLLSSSRSYTKYNMQKYKKEKKRE